MKSLQNLFILIFLGLHLGLAAQYQFTVDLEEESDYQVAYLSLVEDYRKIAGVYEDQIIKQVAIRDGYFQFEGDNLDSDRRIYRIHVDNCNDEGMSGHFNGQCHASRSVVFIASNLDTIRFPVRFENQLLCDIRSENTYSNALSRVDSIKEQMTFDYLSYRSSANKQINDKNWFAKLKQFGKELDEPLAELYIYQFLSDRRSDFYDAYLEDLGSSSYYDELQDRLADQYPDAVFTKQYKSELASDRYRLQYDNGQSFQEVTITMPWWLIISILLVLLIAVGSFVYFKKTSGRSKKQQAVTELTQQEQKVLDLLLENKTNKEIAQEIFVSVSTVKTHTNNLYKKLKVSSRDEVKVLFNK